MHSGKRIRNNEILKYKTSNEENNVKLGLITFCVMQMLQDMGRQVVHLVVKPVKFCSSDAPQTLRRAHSADLGEFYVVRGIACAGWKHSGFFSFPSW